MKTGFRRPPSGRGSCLVGRQAALTADPMISVPRRGEPSATCQVAVRSSGGRRAPREALSSCELDAQRGLLRGTCNRE